MFKLLGLFVLLGFVCAACGKAVDPVGKASNAEGPLIPVGEGNYVTSSSTAEFGEKIRFTKAMLIMFPDLSVVYTGERRVVSDLANGAKPGFREFVFHDFKITAEKGAKTVSWSSGTGDIAPTVFEIGGAEYELELGMSDKLGRLAENEMVIWKKR